MIINDVLSERLSLTLILFIYLLKNKKVINRLWKTWKTKIYQKPPPLFMFLDESRLYSGKLPKANGCLRK